MPESEGSGSATVKTFDEEYDEDDDDEYIQHCEIPAEISAAPRRVDKSHGFMRSIIKNQVDRDNYDKEVKATKAAQGPKRVTPASSRPKRPERATYQPPSIRRALFVLEYSDQNQRQWKHTVREGDTPEQVLEQIEKQRGELGPQNIRNAFIKFTTEEFRKRNIPVSSKRTGTESFQKTDAESFQKTDSESSKKTGTESSQKPGTASSSSATSTSASDRSPRKFY